MTRQSNEKNENILTRTYMIAFLAILCNFLWGSAFPSIKIGYELFQINSDEASTQILFAGCRFALAGVMTIVFGSILSKKVLCPKRESWKRIAVLSTFQTILQYICFYIGLANTTGVKASIIEGMNVFVAIFIASVIFRQEKLTSLKFVGSLLGFIGILLVNLNGEGLEFSFRFLGEGMIMLSTVAYGMSSGIIKIYGKEDDSVMLSGYQFFFGGVVMMLLGSVSGGRIVHVTGEGLLMLLYLAFVSACAYTVWALLLKYNPVSKVAVFGFSNPMFGALLSALLLKESNQNFGWKELIALLLVCIGIFIVQKQKAERT